MPLERNRRRRRLWPCILIFVVTAVSWFSPHTATAMSSDPYKILGVSRRASNAEIKKSYRKLCLLYHPDKNVQKTATERTISEQKFKQIRQAYDSILNKDSFGLGTGGVQMPEGYFTALFRNFWVLLSRPDLFLAEMRKLNLFATGSPIATRGQRNPGEPDIKSIYFETIKVPLEDLYRGVPLFRMRFKDNIWKRYRASIRGNFFIYSLYQASAIAFPIVSKSKVIAWLIGLYILHGTTPVPDPNSSYFTTIQRGTKGGEKTVRFANWKELEVIFQIQEAGHSIYHRVGENLHAELILTRKQAKKGCLKRLKALDPAEDDIKIRIPAKKYSYKKEQAFLQQQKTRRKEAKEPNETKKSHRAYDNTIRIPGRGWPIRNRTKSNVDFYSQGDLFVTIKVQPPKSKKNGETKKRSSSIFSFLSRK